VSVGFLVDRVTYFRLFGPVIEEALDQGLDVVLLLRDAPGFRQGPKGYQWPDPAEVPRFTHGVPRLRQWDVADTLAALCAREGIDVVVSVWLYPADYALCRRLQAQGVRWVSLQHGCEHLAMPAATLQTPDATCMFSPHWARHATAFVERQAGAAGAAALDGRLRATGFPELDTLKTLDPHEIRRRWGIPAGRPVVVWLPHDYHAHDLWEMLVYRRRPGPRTLLRAARAGRWDLLRALPAGPTDGAVARALRAFCDANGAYLIVKSRIKDRPSRADRRAADLFTFDRTYHPPTILEALAVADLCVHVLSVATLEAAYAGVGGLCLIPPPASEFISDPDTGWGRTAPDIRAPDTLWNFAGVSTMLTLGDAVARLPGLRLDAFRVDPARRADYLERFVGPADGRSAARVLDVVRARRGGAR
jgi:hypothetical protein